jgi:type I restriction enzyme S subunit
MVGEWRETSIGEFAPFAYGKALPEHRRDSSGDVPVFGSNGVVGFHGEALTSGPTVIIGRKGTVGAVHYSPNPCWPIDTTFYVVDPDPDVLRFKYYLLKSLDLEHMNADSAVPGLNRDAAHALKISVPPLPEQRAIAHILGTLDDKIELNRRMSETLEAMARALFKAWFVDFEPVRAKTEGRWRRGQSLPGLPAHLYDLFPDRLVDSELGEIPEGWGVDQIGNHFRVTMGQSPPGNTYNEKGDGLPFYQGRVDFGFRFPTRRVFCTAPTRLAEAGDTLVTVRAPVGDSNMALERCCIGRGVAAVRHASGAVSYTYYFVRSLKSVFESFEAEGTVFGAITKDAFLSIKCVVPPTELVQRFEQLCRPIDEKIERAERESRTLAALRDALLPKLIRGEIRVKDAERFLEERRL